MDVYSSQVTAERAGIAVDDLDRLVGLGVVTPDVENRYTAGQVRAFSGLTFAQFAEQAGIPRELLLLIREAAGSPPPLADDRIRDEELPYAEFIAAQLKAGFRRAPSVECFASTATPRAVWLRRSRRGGNLR